MFSFQKKSVLICVVCIVVVTVSIITYMNIQSKLYLTKLCMTVMIFSFAIVYYRSKLLIYTEPIKGDPVWKEEISKWRKDKSYMPQVRPVLDGGELRMKLSE